MKKTALLSHADCLLHEMGEHHPESPKRIGAIMDALHEANLFDFLQHHEAPLATRAAIEQVHAADYLDWIEARAPQQGHIHLDMDTAMNPATLKAAYRAAGAVVHAVDLVMAGQADNAFCNIRPPGHHAESGQAMGFCFFNNIAIGAAHALNQHGLERVAVLDFDVHHGNGTEQIFEHDPRVMICSTFQHHLYPQKHYEQAHERIINATLEPGAGSSEFRDAFTSHWLPALQAFQPQFIFISAGFDAHWLDPLAELNLHEADYYWVTQKVATLASHCCQGRIVSALEGGYNLKGLGASAVQHVRGLMGL